jgi:phage gp16-like protein
VRKKRGKNKEVAEETKARNVDEEDEDSMTWDGDYDEDMSDDEFEEPRKVHLERWQLKKLAAASEIGRRKVNVSSSILSAFASLTKCRKTLDMDILNMI